MAKYSKEQRDRAMDLYIRYERCAADVDWLQCIRPSDEGRMAWDWRPTMAGPEHPRHHGEAFKRQIVQLYESGKPSRKIRRRGPTSSGPSSWATPTPGSRRPTTGSRSPSAWPMASTTSTTSSPSSCSAAADSTYAYPNQEPNPRKQQKPLTYLLIQGMRDLWYLWLEKDNEGLRKDA